MLSGSGKLMEEIRRVGVLDYMGLEQARRLRMETVVLSTCLPKEQNSNNRWIPKRGFILMAFEQILNVVNSFIMLSSVLQPSHTWHTRTFRTE